MLAWYQGTGILKSDCKQPLRIEIIRALNECTGRLFRAATRHNHKSSDMQSKKISNDQEVPALDINVLFYIYIHISQLIRFVLVTGNIRFILYCL